MRSGILKNIKNAFLALLFSITCFHLSAQFYNSPVTCVSGLMSNPSTGAVTGCESPTQFFDTDTTSTKWEWDFGDGFGMAFTRNPSYLFPAPGIFTVTLKKYQSVSSIPQVVSKQITVGTLPQEPLFNGKAIADTTVCGGNTLKLDPFKTGTFPPNYNYLWYPKGDTTRTIDVDSSGCYSVEVSDPITGCSRTARINVKFCLQPAASGGGPEKWYFGNGATLEFILEGEEVKRDSLDPEGEFFTDPELDNTSYNPTDNPGSNPLITDVASSMVYGPTGALAFYTDGKNLYNGNDELITDTSGVAGLNGNNTATQGLVIIPKVACVECAHHQYYVFKVDKDTKLLSYSIIDMRYNNGVGQIVDKDIPVAWPVTESISAVTNSSQTGFVVIAHEAGTGNFSLINVDSTGIRVVNQSIGMAEDNLTKGTGYVAVSPSGTKIAKGTVINGQNYVEVFDLDPDGLVLGNPKLIDLGIAAPPEVYGLAFAENSDILYVTLNGDPALRQKSYLIQLALFLDDPAIIAAQKNIIDENTGLSLGAIKLGPVNGMAAKYMYIAVNNQPKVPFIQNPDQVGNAAAVGYSILTGAGGNKDGVNVSGTSKLGLPNVIFAKQESDSDGITANYSGNCFNAPTLLTTQDVCSPLRNQVEWEFEDGEMVKGTNVVHTFSHLGWNKFTLRFKIFNTSPLKKIINSQVLNVILNLTESVCEQEEYVDSIYIKPSPISNLSDSTYLCVREGQIGKLNPMATDKADSLTYTWFTSIGTQISTDSILSVVAPAVYKLEILNKYDCQTKDEIKVIEGCEPRMFAPEAFTPNGDGDNDTFQVFYAHITDFNLLIYNRWGELVFESDNPENKWDGKVKGKVFGPAFYPYVITYKSLDFPERGILRERGTIVVIK